jgi:hypothetical protein
MGEQLLAREARGTLAPGDGERGLCHGGGQVDGERGQQDEQEGRDAHEPRPRTPPRCSRR